MLRSLRSKLLAWYSLALVIVTAAFAALLYLNVRGTIYREIDLQLEQNAIALRDAMRLESDKSFSLELAPEQIERFGQDGDNTAYYAIWDDAGHLVDQSHPNLEVRRPEAIGVWNEVGNREHTIAGPAGSLVLVGQGMQEENARLNQLFAVIWTVGGLVLVGTLAAGWFLTGRRLRRSSESARRRPAFRPPISRRESIRPTWRRSCAAWLSPSTILLIGSNERLNNRLNSPPTRRTNYVRLWQR